jgi:hypothetical protein
MKKFKTGLVNALFFIIGDLAYSVFSTGKETSPLVFLGIVTIILLMIALHKMDVLMDSQSPKQILKEKKFTNWILCTVLGSGFAFTSHGSILLRWIFENS